MEERDAHPHYFCMRSNSTAWWLGLLYVQLNRARAANYGELNKPSRPSSNSAHGRREPPATAHEREQLAKKKVTANMLSPMRAGRGAPHVGKCYRVLDLA
jgi:hypothetical protein